MSAEITARAGMASRARPAPVPVLELRDVSKVYPVIVITHDHAVAARMRCRIEVLDGHIVADTRPVSRTQEGTP